MAFIAAAKFNFKYAVIYKAPVNIESGLRMFGLNPGNCLSALGTVGTAATIIRLMPTHLLFIIELIVPL